MIIGVAGKKRSGKDTFYEIVKEELKNYYDVKKYAFADLVKDYAVEYFNIDRRDIKKEENRFILQGIGQMFREKVQEDYWIQNTFLKIYNSRKRNPNEISIITDVRYINEAMEIERKDQGLLLKIVNKNNKSFDFHVSENELNDYEFDCVINNNGTFEDYRKEVLLWIRSYLPWINP